MSALPEEPAWRRRAVERSTRAAKLRAEQRVQGLLDAARRLIAEKGTDFTVQEVVERSKQSLRSFYQHFDGKHELLLALFEDALARCSDEVRKAASGPRDPLERLRAGIGSLYEQSRPNPGTGMQSPLYSDFALQLLVRHPDQVATAHLPLLGVLSELIEAASEAGAIPPGRPRRQASLVMQTVMIAAQGNGVPAGGHTTPASADEVWQFCFTGISGART
ncbi:TetR/AcrR family transcriptional regulator [Actinomadura sp. 7K507]|uniref:TetR/AcrR family transcriptional regulator n=1 Tax=Actinomadura sp. 7K507 TaxID=2530365 RepID=UPI001049A77A|nr:TetR/AcrR family transcriptional regulator [Actinomadura sp. 7K507]TDC97946.1 TetR/AcrR family transcriptional regulator [Actinomadura sp. 7K507]